MSNKAEKIITKMKNTKKGHSFEDCEKVLTSIDYIISYSKGSHFTFKNSQTKHRIVIAKHKPIDPKAIIDILEACNKSGEI